ncbi:very-long-chain enoyl-CoA reductase [Elysia marginata]|uniref:Very-long-chain enoyl-CoA reductase n=1 Tax=Elysia marginata TaxID=1093978 RepID=A0AAV4JQT6_9GAST|nr:very-long-chain enoyl-CoA reductase [Elysia marginata]
MLVSKTSMRFKAYRKRLTNQYQPERIRQQVEKYLSPSQSGFRPDRSTADVVWTHKWLAAKTNAENVEIKITGIDMSAAFDTIDRKALLDILKTIIDKDEHALRDIRTNISPPTDIERLLPREVAYADDVDFVSLEFVKVGEVKKALGRHRLFVNVDKTDFTTLSRNAKDWRETKKVGSLIGDKEDVERRKQLSTAALLKLRNIWIGGGKFLGRPITILPNLLNKDLTRLPTGEFRLKTNEDLDHLRSIAQDRQQWKGLTTKIPEAAEASMS